MNGIMETVVKIGMLRKAVLGGISDFVPTLGKITPYL
jgi:hypothetical protein